MIESAKFTNVNGSFVNLNDDDIPFDHFTTECDLRFTDKDRSQQHGIYPGDLYYGKRLFHIEGDLFGQNSDQYIQRRLALQGVLAARPQYGRKIIGTLDILFSGMAEHLTCDVTLDGYPDLPIEANAPARTRFSLSFKTFDPRMYGGYQSADIAYDPSWQNPGGRSYNKTYNKNYSAASATPGEALIVNTGNFDTYPIITFYGPATSPMAAMYRSDGQAYYFTLNGLVLSSINESAIVDFQRKTVTRNDGTNLYNYSIGSDWWVLEPQPFTQTVRFDAASLSIPAHMTIQWRNAYMF